ACYKRTRGRVGPPAGGPPGARGNAAVLQLLLAGPDHASVLRRFQHSAGHLQRNAARRQHRKRRPERAASVRDARGLDRGIQGRGYADRRLPGGAGDLRDHPVHAVRRLQELQRHPVFVV
ncbi:MAG: hypothetical protein AVDCRST_MAG89-4215, partial [uncultured Gemmatimonadetes bacterium]